MNLQSDLSATRAPEWPAGSTEPEFSLARLGGPSVTSIDAPAETDRPLARERIGLDANRPIDPGTGEIEPQVADPDVIASTGAGWVRLNFILGPWSSPLDTTEHGGRTWAETYEQIIAGFRKRGLNVYGLVGSEAMPRGPGERFRSAPPDSDAADSWLEQYVNHFATIVELFSQDVWVFESFNEPDDWHGQPRNLIHPGWFAIMLQRIWEAVRTRPELNHVRLVSGPLQGLQASNNAAAYYLQSTYRAGKRLFGWGLAGQPFPFHGVGYHLYVRQEFNPYRQLREQAIQVTLSRYLGAMHRVIRQEEGQDKPLYVSELGWSSTVENRELRRREEYQADCLRSSMEILTQDALVDLSIWFCTLDFSTKEGSALYGLYRAGDPTPDGRKPAFQAFREACKSLPDEASSSRRVTAGAITNQCILNAFYRTAVELERDDRWELLHRAGLDLRTLVVSRQAVYDGPATEALPGLTDEERASIQSRLDDLAYSGAGWQQERPAGVLAELHVRDPVATGQSDLRAEPDLDLTLALQEYVLAELERNNELLEQALRELGRRSGEGLDFSQVLAGIGVFTFMIALAVSVVAAILISMLLR